MYICFLNIHKTKNDYMKFRMSILYKAPCTWSCLTAVRSTLRFSTPGRDRWDIQPVSLCPAVLDGAECCSEWYPHLGSIHTWARFKNRGGTHLRCHYLLAAPQTVCDFAVIVERHIVATANAPGSEPRYGTWAYFERFWSGGRPIQMDGATPKTLK